MNLNEKAYMNGLHCATKQQVNQGSHFQRARGLTPGTLFIFTCSVNYQSIAYYSKRRVETKRFFSEPPQLI